MIRQWLLDILGATEKIENLALSYVSLEQENKELKKENTRLIQERDISKAELLGATNTNQRALRIMESGVGDVAPTDEKQRRDYAAQAANFYDAILEKKLMQMIAQLRETLDTVFQSIPEGMDRVRYDDFLRGTSNAFKLLIEWGESMKGEHQSNITKESNQ